MMKQGTALPAESNQAEEDRAKNSKFAAAPRRSGMRGIAFQ
jgi:hypothetical protein